MDGIEERRVEFLLQKQEVEIALCFCVGQIDSCELLIYTVNLRVCVVDVKCWKNEFGAGSTTKNVRI